MAIDFFYKGAVSFRLSSFAFASSHCQVLALLHMTDIRGLSIALRYYILVSLKANTILSLCILLVPCSFNLQSQPPLNRICPHVLLTLRSYQKGTYIMCRYESPHLACSISSLSFASKHLILTTVICLHRVLWPRSGWPRL